MKEIRIKKVGCRFEGEIYKDVDQEQGISIFYVKTNGMYYSEDGRRIHNVRFVEV